MECRRLRALCSQQTRSWFSRDDDNRKRAIRFHGRSAVSKTRKAPDAPRSTTYRATNPYRPPSISSRSVAGAIVALNLLSLNDLGAVEANGNVAFGLWLPWVSGTDGNRISVKIIHEEDQFLQEIPAREFALAHSLRAPYGDFWSGTVPIGGTDPALPGSAWGKPGRYVYRYQINNPNVGTLDWIIDPFAREFGVGKLSAFTLGYQPYSWSENEDQWRTPDLADLVVYEIEVAEFGGDLDQMRRSFPISPTLA